MPVPTSCFTAVADSPLSLVCSWWWPTEKQTVPCRTSGPPSRRDLFLSVQIHHLCPVLSRIRGDSLEATIALPFPQAEERCLSAFGLLCLPIGFMACSAYCLRSPRWGFCHTTVAVRMQALVAGVGNARFIMFVLFQLAVFCSVTCFFLLSPPLPTLVSPSPAGMASVLGVRIRAHG